MLALPYNNWREREISWRSFHGNLFHNFVPTCIIRSSEFFTSNWSTFSTIALLVPPGRFSTATLWNLLSPFSDIPFMMMSQVTTTFFLFFLCFDGLFASSFPIPVLLTFCISVSLLVVMGCRWLLLVAESEVSKFLLLSFKRK